MGCRYKKWLLYLWYRTFLTVVAHKNGLVIFLDQNSKFLFLVDKKCNILCIEHNFLKNTK